MAEVLSQKQIDELLGNLASGGSIEPEPAPEPAVENVATAPGQPRRAAAAKEKPAPVKYDDYKEYDFRTPKRITRERIKLLDSIFENFTRLLSLQIAGLIRLNCEIEIISLEEQQYYEYGNALADSVLVGGFGLFEEGKDSDDNQLLVEMSKTLSFMFLDKLLGGEGEGGGVNPDKDYTDIELPIMEMIFKKISSVFTNAWANYIDIECEHKYIETNARLIQSIAPDETVMIIILICEVKGQKEKISICIPAETLKIIFKSFDQKFTRVARRSDPETEKRRHDYLMDSLNSSDLVVTGILGKTQILLDDLLHLQAGDVIPLPTPTQGDTIKIMVDDSHWFDGVMGVKKKKYAVKINEVLE